MIDYTLIREDIIASLERYVKHGIKCGDFLTAVLANDLTEACGRADDDNQRTLFHIVAYIYNELPSDCWGSYTRVDGWIERKRQVASAQ